MRNTIKWSYLGSVGYEDACKIQENLQSNIIKGIDSSAGYLLILEHQPVITVGKFGNDSNLLIPKQVLKQRGIDIFKTNRGGDYTYHGPGQMVCYPILNLRNIGVGVKKYVNSLEEIIIKMLNMYEISAERRHSYPGVWVGNKKIAFIGISVKRNVTMHGFSLNLDIDPRNYTYMNPCGINGLEVTSVSDLYSGKLLLDILIKGLVSQFYKEYNCNLVENNDFVRGIKS
jgi:lipoyl(octanoyl) transferase